MNPNKKFGCSLFYTVFLNNAYRFLPLFEDEGVPFIFTLYPGGGFWLNNEESDKKLHQVCCSPLLRKIIVTQKLTYDYLVYNNFCSYDKIEFVYGVVLPSDRFQRHLVPKKRYKKEKKTFDICFVAHKYTEGGRDKGYNTFIEVAHRLMHICHDVHFHVVGNFDDCDIDVSMLKDKIVFYGYRCGDFFSEFYSRMDLILSPNIPFVQAPGKFDGFPTGACVEAGLNGVAVFCTDVLNMNNDFENGRHLCIIPCDIDGILKIILDYYNDVAKLYELSNRGMEIFCSLFQADRQMAPRLKVIDKHL